MARVALVAALVLPLAFGACDSSKDTPTAPAQTPYAGNQPGGTPAAPARAALTQAEFDLWVKAQIDHVKKKPRGPADQKALLDAHGLSVTEWGVLYGRVMAANGALTLLEKRNEPVPAHLVADVELLKTNRERLEKTLKGQE